MTYARNNATPRPILIGTIVQISDGAVQTTGVLVKVAKDGGAFTAGANTPTVEEGQWSYTPSQGETNCETLRIVLYKTGCYSCSQQVVFSASESFGHIGTDQSKIANPTSTVNLSNTSIKTATDVETNTQDIQNRLPAALDAGRMVVTVGAYQTGNVPLQPTIAGRTLDVTANGNAGIDWGNIDNQTAVASFTNTYIKNVDYVNEITGDVSNIAIAVWGHLVSDLALLDPSQVGKLLVTNIDATISSRLAATSYTAPLNAAGTASAVWNALIASYTVADSFGSRVMRTDNASAGNGAKVTGAGHVAADIHELQPAVIDNTHFAPGAIDANALAADAVAEIQNGLALETSSQSILAKIGAFTGTGVNTILGFFRALLRSDGGITTPSDVGGTFTHTTDSTQAIRDRGDAAWTTGGGGGGGGTIIVSPLSSTGIDRVQGTTIRLFTEEQISHSVDIYDSSGSPINLAAMTLQLDVATEGKQVLMSLASGSINVSGASSNKITFTNNAASSARSGVHYWALRNEADGDRVVAHGLWIVNKTAKVGP